jgi:uncharacterized membrane protein
MIKNDDSNVNTVNVYSLEKITSKENSQQINIKKNNTENPQEISHQENSRLENSTMGNNIQEQTSNNKESCFSQKKNKNYNWSCIRNNYWRNNYYMCYIIER